MRTEDIRTHQDVMGRFDTAVRQCLERELGVSLEDNQWVQATLPVPLGGLELRSVVVHSPEAYIASLGASADIIEEVVGRRVEMKTKVEELVGLVNVLSGNGELTPETSLVTTQKMISHSIDQHQAKVFQDTLQDEVDGDQEFDT